MRDAFAGDIGDFSKFGLLRWLCGMTAGDDLPTLRLGINWYLFTGRQPEKNNDGKFIQFLADPSVDARLLRNCDFELIEILKPIANAKRRRISDYIDSGVLLPDTLYYDEDLNYDNTRLDLRAELRVTWAAKGAAKLEPADLVCVDPDNGLKTPGADYRRRTEPKYAYYGELETYWNRGQSLVIYQHTDHQSKIEKQTAKRAEILRATLSGSDPIAVRFRRRSSRVYFVVAQPHHADVLHARIRSFLNSDWGKGNAPHFELVPC